MDKTKLVELLEKKVFEDEHNQNSLSATKIVELFLNGGIIEPSNQLVIAELMKPLKKGTRLKYYRMLDDNGFGIGPWLVI